MTDRCWRCNPPTPDEAARIVGGAELAVLLRVKPGTVSQWKNRKLLPPADMTVNGRPAWTVGTIMAWATDTGRVPSEGPDLS